MQVRILRKPTSYEVEGESLYVGRVYNLDAALASALLVDGYAELAELAPETDRASSVNGELWQAADRQRRRRRSLL